MTGAIASTTAKTNNGKARPRVLGEWRGWSGSGEPGRRPARPARATAKALHVPSPGTCNPLYQFDLGHRFAGYVAYVDSSLLRACHGVLSVHSRHSAGLATRLRDRLPWWTGLPNPSVATARVFER